MTTLDRDLASEEHLPDRELDPYAALLARLSHQQAGAARVCGDLAQRVTGVSLCLP